MLGIALAIATPFAAVAGWLGYLHLRFSAYHRFKRTELAPLGVSGWLRVHLREAWAFGVLGVCTARALAADGLRAPATPTGRPVLCVHGFTQNGTNFWRIRAALEASGRPTRALFLGFPPRDLDVYAARLIPVLRELARDAADGIDVIAHSMGGIVLRRALALEPALAASVRRIVTLGSPHRGTALTRGLRVFAEGRQLARRSAFLAELPDFCALSPHAEVTTVAGGQDLVVYPRETCHLPGTTRVEVEGVGHAGLLVHAEVIDAVIAAIVGRARAEAPAA